MAQLRVGLLQLALKRTDPEGNFQDVLTLLDRASGWDCHVLVLPELWNAVIPLDNSLSLLDEGEPILSRLRELARKRQVSIIAGSLAVRTAQGNRNRTYVISPCGDVLLRYDKVHLHPKLKEEHAFVAGQSLGLVDLPGFRAGVLICFDVEFPEQVRALALRGAQVLFVPGAWAQPYVHLWRTLLAARALENQLFVVGVNRCDRGPTLAYGGHSLVVNPFGDVLLHVDHQPHFEIVTLDLEAVGRARARHEVLSSLRPSLYRRWL
jgi:predicted amidohydrolase